LAIFLLDRGFSPIWVGAIFSATLIEDAVVTTLVSIMAVRIGLRRVLLASSLLVVICGLALAFCSIPLVVILAAVFGIVSPAGDEGGPFSPVEQTIISDSEPVENLTRAFSWYNLTGFAGAALGALFAGAAVGFAHAAHADIYPAMFVLYALGGSVLALLYGSMRLERHSGMLAELNRTVEPGADSADVGDTLKSAFTLHRSKKHVLKLGALQSLDALGGGFVAQSLIAYWFYLRYQAGPEFTGPIFFWTNVLAAVSFTVAPLIVKRLGLLKTMVFTHLPCSLALCLIPFMPDAASAGLILLVRSLFSSMDIPVRQAFTMLMVSPDERPAAAGVISAARAMSQGLSPLFAGISMSGGAVFGLPFIFAGVAKSIYDVGLYAFFAGVPLHSVSANGSILAEELAMERNISPQAMSIDKKGEEKELQLV